MTEFKPYKGYKITYSEDANVWDGESAGKHASLKALKAKIDDMERAGRKLGITALMIHSDWRNDQPELREVTVTSIAEGRDFGSGEAWITYAREKSKERSKVSISQLYPVEMRDKLEEYFGLKRAATEAEKQAERFLDALTGFTTATLQEAVKPKEETK